VLDSGHYGKAADVYSFGIMVIELLNNRHPFHFVKFKVFVEFGKMLKEQSIQPELPENCPEKLIDLCKKYIICREIESNSKRCVSYDMAARPSFEEILISLKNTPKTYQF
jgi:serine/threonine protein kinase